MQYLCHINDIPEGQSKGYMLNDHSVFAVCCDDVIFVYENKCPHLGVELDWLEDQFLDSEGRLIQCATHGALFVVESGVCVAGPCHGKTLNAIPLKIIDQQVWLNL